MKIKILMSFLSFFHGLRWTYLPKMEKLSYVMQWMHFEIGERESKHIELVAAQCASLYTFPYNHIWLNVAQWDSCCSLAKQISIRILFPLFKYYWGKWYLFHHRPEYFAYFSEDTFHPSLPYSTREVFFHFCVYPCSINVRIRPIGLIFSSDFSWSWMGQPYKLLLPLSCGPFLRMVSKHKKTFSRHEVVL